MLFEPVRILFPVAIGGIAGVTASAAGSGGAVCPSTAGGGAVIYLCTGRSFIGGASAWFCLLLWLTAVSLACGLAFAVLRGGGGFPRGY